MKSVRTFFQKPATIYLLAFLLPVLTMLTAAGLEGWFTPDKTSILETDVNSQYINFLTYYKHLLSSEESIFYTLSLGMGDNFYALSAYYLFSPLNLIVLLFPVSNLPVAFISICFIKIGLSGLTMAYCLRNTISTKWHCLIFSYGYALCAYSSVYYYNIMWLDGVLLLPLIVASLFLLLKRQSHSVSYILLLFLSIITNYYIGWMICIFLPICFFLYSILYFDCFRTALKSFFIFLQDSFLAAGLSAFVLLPVFFAMRESSKSLDMPPFNLTFQYSFSEFILQFFRTAQVDKNNGLPNLFCGCLIFFLFLLFFLQKNKISPFKKGMIALLFFLLMLSSQITFTNLIWHGFNYNISYPYRYSFIITFLVILLAYSSFCTLDYHYCKSFIYKTALPVAILFHLIDVFSFTCLHLDGGVISAEKYKRDTLSISKIIQELPPHSNIYRCEKNFRRTPNDSLQMQYNGLSYSTSTASKYTAAFLNRLGVYKASTGINVYYEPGVSSFVDSFLGVKYLVTDSAFPLKNYTLIDKTDQYYLFHNETALPLIYHASNKIYNFNSDFSQDTFLLQNQIASAIAEQESTIYESINFNRTSEDHISYSFTAKQNGFIYCSLSGPENHDVELYVNEKKADDFYIRPYHSYNIGFFSAGEDVTVELFYSYEPVFTTEAFYGENYDNLLSLYHRLEAGKGTLEKKNNSYLKGKITVTSSHPVALLTIPYDKSWSLLVDGEKTELVCVLDNLMAFQSSPGTHIFELRYRPRGFTAGCIVSITFLLLLIILALFNKKSHHPGPASNLPPLDNHAKNFQDIL